MIEPNWPLVQGHLALTGSVSLSAKILGISIDHIEKALTSEISYPDNWDVLKTKRPQKIELREKLAKDINHPSTGVAGRIEKELVWGSKTQKEIAKLVGCTQENVFYYNRRMQPTNKGITRRSFKSLTPEEVAKVHESLKQGISLNRIASEQGCTPNSIRNLKERGIISYPSMFFWANVPNEFLFIKGTDRSGWKHKSNDNSRGIPYTHVFKDRIVADRLMPLKCAVTGDYADKRRPHTKLHVFRVDGDKTNNQLSNLILISARHHPDTPPPRGFLFQPWKQIEREYNSGMFRKDLLEEYDMSEQAWYKAVDDGLMDIRSNNMPIYVYTFPWADIQRDYDNGMPITKIRKQYRLSNRVWRMGKKLNLFRKRK